MDSFATAPPEHHPAPTFSGNSGHPPYPEMIIAAIATVDEKDGSSRQAIARYIEREYSNLPPTHPNLLTHHLKRMKNEGQLIMIKHSYALPPPRSVPFQPVMDNHFTDYSITTASVTPRRKPGRPPKSGHDFGYQVLEEQPPEIQPCEPQHFPTQNLDASLGLATPVSSKRGRGRPPKGGSASGSGGRPKLMMSVNGGEGKMGRPRRIGGPVTVPLSGPRGTVSTDAESGSVSRRGRPLKNKLRNSFGSTSKVGSGTMVLVSDPHELVAYQELKSKYERLQSKAKEVVGVVRPYINPDSEAFGALQELEMMMVGTYAIVEREKQQPYA